MILTPLNPCTHSLWVQENLVEHFCTKKNNSYIFIKPCNEQKIWNFLFMHKTFDRGPVHASEVHVPKCPKFLKLLKARKSKPCNCYWQFRVLQKIYRLYIINNKKLQQVMLLHTLSIYQFCLFCLGNPRLWLGLTFNFFFAFVQLCQS